MTRINQMEPSYGGEEKHAIAAYLDSGAWLTEFKKTREFEQMIAAYTGSKHCAVATNGTITLMVALWALGIGHGDEVIVPDYTMIASSNAIVLVGATPVFVDIDLQTLCLDLMRTEAVVTPRTKAVMYVSINGRCGDMNALVELCKRRRVALLEDAAQSLGSRFGGKHLGTFGDIGSFSFSAPKVITTGQGGALVTDSEDLFRKIWKVRDFGRSKGGVDYHESMGLNAKFTDLQAVLGIEQMKKLEWRVQRKKDMFRLYERLLADLPHVQFIKTDLAGCSPWFMDVLVKGEGVRDKLAAHLDKREIGTRPFYPAIHTQPPYAHVKGDFPHSLQVSAEGLWLPSSSFLTDEDVTRVCAEIRGFFRGT